MSERRMVELPVKPYVFVKKLVVIQKIFDIFGVITQPVVSLEFAKVMLPLLGTRISLTAVCSLPTEDFL